MDNINYLALPIKSLNNVVKFKVQESNSYFNFDSKGCIFKGCYYDFRVTKLIDDFELKTDTEENENIIIHVNQITVEQDLILCVVLKDSLQCFILNQTFFSTFKDRLIYQHKNSYYQLHQSFKFIKDNAELACIIR
jgi:hypothetical protein